MNHPPEVLHGHGVLLRRVRPDDARLVADALTRSVAHLTGWMAWAPTAALTEDEQRPRLAEVDRDWEEGREYRYAVLATTGAGPLRGLASLMRRIGPRALEIGYWIDVDSLRRGYATAAARALTHAALALPDVDRVEIRCDEANTASARIPPRLGFRLDRIDDKPPAAPLETGRNMVWVKP